MASPRTTLITRLILEHRGQVLLLAQTVRNGGKHALPGGKVEPNETPLTALIRESKEEADINVAHDNLKLAHVLHRQKDDETLVVIYYKSSKWQGDLVSKEPKKFKKAAWYPLDNLPKNISRITKSVLEHYRKGVTYSETDERKVKAKLTTI
jgi:ADP-ribose pyrophosphatase YjhB (NUDIX family)